MNSNRFDVLDGWRAISILLVLLVHFFPMGPHAWQLGKTVGDYALTIFFILSGFLITRGLISGQTVKSFLIRRLLRILPLAWLYLSIVLIFYQMNLQAIFAHFFFYANYPPKPFVPLVTEHFWSLCVEVQFYAGIALLFAFFRRQAIFIVPIICIGFTLLRVINGMTVSVVTHYRVDDILAGSLLAISFSKESSFVINRFLGRVNPIFLAFLLLPASHEHAGFISYFRPYIAAALVGATLFQPEHKISKLLVNRFFAYIASVSYAVYVIHPLMAKTWLGSGDLLEKYTKRPLLLAAVFALAHISTNFYERKAIKLAKYLTKD